MNEMSEPKKPEPLSREGSDRSPSRAGGEVYDESPGEPDAVFGEIRDDGPNYRSLGWLGTVALMMKTELGLGILSIPKAFDTLGLIPGVICLVTISAMTTWSAYIIGVFKVRHRQVYGIDDVGELLFGRIGREFFYICFCLYWIFAAGSGMLSLSIGLNAVSSHGACTAVFVAVAAIIGFVFSSIRTLGKISLLAWFGLFCIITAIMIVTIAVGIQDRPSAAPQEGPWSSDYQLFKQPTFAEAVSSVSTMVFAYGGTVGFFSIAAEMRDPRLYKRSLLVCQGSVTALYVAIGVVVYYYCGSFVTSPALGSAGPLLKKIAYGFALPGLAMTTILVTHMPAKFIFVRILRGTKHLTGNTLVHWATWLGCTFGVNLVAYLIASGIPVFDSLVSLVGALLGCIMAFQPMGAMWFYDNWSSGKKERRPQWVLMVCWCVFVIVGGTFLMVSGTYGAILSIIASYKDTEGQGAWSCADNSNS